jgi:signal transduction histidine kinase
MLNKAITELTQKNKEVFESQKQFIENASHEMNTPLTIVQSRLETLIGHTNLTGEQASIVEGIIRSTQRLKKLNRTLLLLSKIENRQFLLSDEVNLNKIIDKSLEYYEEQKAALNIKVAIEYQDSLIVQGNIMLTEILIQNLLKNAFLHNIQDGTITISANHHMLTIANTGPNTINSGKGPALDEEKLFSRFFKKSENPDTWGLGLAIAHKIAETSGWGLKYRKEEVLHVFEVFFK